MAFIAGARRLHPMLRTLRAARALSPLSACRPHTRRYAASYRPYERVLCLERRDFSTQAGLQASDDPTHRSWIDRFLDELQRRTFPRGEKHNTADQIEDHLREHGHRIWGFAIYRCTYGDDAAWATFLERLNASIRETMRYYNGLDLLEADRFKLTVFDDASTFDGADTHVVRRHFQEWRKRAVHEEQSPPEEVEPRLEEARRKEIARDGGSDHPTADDYCRMAVRYRLCVQVDEAALQSIVSRHKDKKSSDEAYVKVIDALWYPEAAAEGLEESRSDHIRMGYDPEDFDDELEVFPEIEGCTDEYVGWMKVPYDSLMPGFYAKMMYDYEFGYMYFRPPDIIPGYLC